MSMSKPKYDDDDDDFFNDDDDDINCFYDTVDAIETEKIRRIGGKAAEVDQALGDTDRELQDADRGLEDADGDLRVADREHEDADGDVGNVEERRSRTESDDQPECDRKEKTVRFQ